MLSVFVFASLPARGKPADNLVKKHQKPVPALNQPGGIVEKEAAIQVSNVAIFNATTGKADRVGFRFEDGKKVRFFKSNSETIK